MTRLRYNELKTTQAAALLLARRGGRMSYMKLIKLLYIADREALIRWGRPITGDAHCALDHGPVLSRTLNLINDGAGPMGESVWLEHISEPQAYDVQLKKDPGDGALSVAETELLEEIFKRHGHLSRWDLVKLTHSFPEWHDPQGGSIRIDCRDILEAGGLTDRQIVDIEEELQGLTDVTEVLNAK